ncbi:zinc transporter ZupT [Georgenia sp. Z1344]|uniref:zinc transporter ZupT n=1 Tax=Georgenia sp. Z1344 TaxID=3416706 RepID=UPI003CE8B01C
MPEGAVLAFLLTLGAGLATTVGALVALSRHAMSDRFLSAALGFSAGVMIYVSFVEILPGSLAELGGALGDGPGAWATTAGFFGGIAVIAIIDRLVPGAANPHEVPPVERTAAEREAAALLRMGTFTAVAIGLHNFPEGFATFITALENPEIGIPVAVAIAIHNVPEGIAVAVPIRRATGSRGTALRWAFLAGLAEPAGALIGFGLLAPFLTPTVTGLALAAVAGVMVFISLDELLPTAEAYGHHHWSVYGLLAGMAVMALSLLMLA